MAKWLFKIKSPAFFWRLLELEGSNGHGPLPPPLLKTKGLSFVFFSEVCLHSLPILTYQTRLEKRKGKGKGNFSYNQTNHIALALTGPQLPTLPCGINRFLHLTLARQPPANLPINHHISSKNSVEKKEKNIVHVPYIQNKLV